MRCQRLALDERIADAILVVVQFARLMQPSQIGGDAFEVAMLRVGAVH